MGAARADDEDSGSVGLGLLSGVCFAVPVVVGFVALVVLPAGARDGPRCRDGASADCEAAMRWAEVGAWAQAVLWVGGLLVVSALAQRGVGQSPRAVVAAAVAVASPVLLGVATTLVR